MCSQCPYDCYGCALNGICTSCSDTVDKRRLFTITNRCLPLAGYFDNSTALSVGCPQQCAMCLKSNVCTACIVGYYLSVKSTCESICQERSVLNYDTFSCQQCPYDCLNCDFDGKCISCDSVQDHRVFDQSTKRCVSLDGYYDNKTRVSLPCPLQCTTCQSATLCLTCATGYFLSQQQCLESCPARFFESPSSKTC
jgi:proprotein convertase subtilisin/kexin type 5